MLPAGVINLRVVPPPAMIDISLHPSPSLGKDRPKKLDTFYEA
jgi:hypothetical protein